ncbi:MAG: hypothetical protein ACOZAN_02405 [Patescibacteria group bacterium]
MPTKRKQLATALENFYQNPIAKVSVELFLSIATIGFFAVFAIRPTLLTMSDLIKEIDDKRELDGKLEKKIAALSTAQTSYLSIEDRIGVVDEAIPSSPNLVQAIKIIEKLSSEQQIAIERLSVKEIPKNEDEKLDFSKVERKSIIIDMAVVGDFPAIRTFIESLQNSRRSFVVNSVTFVIEDNRGFQKLRATINISAPYFGRKSGVESDVKAVTIKKDDLDV